MKNIKISWLSMTISFLVLTLFSILMFFLKQNTLQLFGWFSASSFPGNQIKIWAILLMTFSILGLVVSILMIALNFKDIDSLNKIATYAHILVALVILFVVLMFIISAIMSKTNQTTPIIILSLSAIAGSAVIGTTAWVAKEELM
ncbi:hypothetical protein [Spiroplasma endosymbiont of Diplazon laetatorius]|uniref:hypothetical protein n=1 Tax=Spiroplasma endosymbiont of Diplazon laetatorius TaxID=3066322 RepID=UPI0030CBB5B8